MIPCDVYIYNYKILAENMTVVVSLISILDHDELLSFLHSRRTKLGFLSPL